MNIQLADRLVTLRKEHNLSQEALAEKLGLSRQAVSKWERAEASPDTDNLIALAEIYGISLDALLGNDVDIEKTSENTEDKAEDTVNKDGKNVDKFKKMLSYAPVILLAVVAIYIICGMLFHLWKILWVLFLLAVAYALYFGSKIVKKKIVSVFLMTCCVTLVASAIYALAGFVFNVWGIAWIVFLAIPAYAYISFIKK